eukprot:1099708-Amphidinium_carterae.1
MARSGVDNHDSPPGYVDDIHEGEVAMQAAKQPRAPFGCCRHATNCGSPQGSDALQFIDAQDGRTTSVLASLVALARASFA